MAYSLAKVVEKQKLKVLARGQRFERFDQLRQRIFWSDYLFAYGGANGIAAGPYEIFKVTPSMTGQGFPAACPLTLLETNWKNPGRVPDNQNIVISSMFCQILRPQAVDNQGQGGAPANAPANGIWANLPAGIQAGINPRAPIHPQDAYNIAYGLVLEMQYLTNSIPLGLIADFTQYAGGYVQEERISDTSTEAQRMGDPTIGVPAFAFARKLEVPIMLQHGEQMGMVLRAPRNIPTLAASAGGAGWAIVRTGWLATESFVEKS